MKLKEIQGHGYVFVVDEDEPLKVGKRVRCTYEGKLLTRTLSPGNVLTAPGEKPIYAPFATVHGVIYNTHIENFYKAWR